jgi:hypothetical protein
MSSTDGITLSLDDITIDIAIDVSDIKYCPGPCKSIEPENNYCFKPNTGGSYSRFIYKMYKGGNLIIKNARICEGCYKLYQYIEYSYDVDADTSRQYSEISADAILSKFNIDI